MLRAIRLLATVLPVALVMLSVPLEEASATTGGCFVSSVAVDEFSDFFFDGVTLSETKSRCKDQCRDFLSGCMSVCSTSDKCTTKGLESFFAGIKRECGDIEDPEEKASCKSDAKGERNEILDILADEKLDAKDLCDETFSSCIAVCKGEIVIEVPEF